MKKKYHAMVLTCMDPRFQPIVHNYLKKRKLNGKYSAFTIAGSAIGVTASKFRKWHNTFWENINISIRLHKIKKLIVINHYDCGAAKIINGKKIFNNVNESKIHRKSFIKIKSKFLKKYPSLSIETILISLNKKVQKF